LDKQKINKLNNRITFGSIIPAIEQPNLLNIQVESFEEFIQLHTPPAKRINFGLQEVFNKNFPVFDNKEFYRLDFIEYYIEKPRFSIPECEERGLSYSAPLKAKLRLSTKDDETNEYVNAIEQEVYLGNLPFMTERGTFIINGAERVIVTQLHRSPGVAFSQTVHPNGTPIFAARIIPFRGSWVEFSTDINNILFVYIDRRKKFPSTTLLRALGYETDEDITNLFNLIEEIKLKKVNLDDFQGRIAADDVIDQSTGEVFVSKEGELTPEVIENIKASSVTDIKLFVPSTNLEENLIINTLKKDISKSKEEALFSIYRQLRTGEAPDLEAAKSLIDKLFFDEKRYDLGEVGRFRMNDKLKLDIPKETKVLTVEDIVAIIRDIIKLRAGVSPSDVIDHLGNRRFRTVGEHLQHHYYIGLASMARTI